MPLVKRVCFILLLFCFRFAFFAFPKTRTLLEPRGLQPFAHFKSKTARLPFFYATKKDFCFRFAFGLLFLLSKNRLLY
jgi:hypothetical protein